MKITAAAMDVALGPIMGCVLVNGSILWDDFVRFSQPYSIGIRVEDSLLWLLLISRIFGSTPEQFIGRVKVRAFW